MREPDTQLFIEDDGTTLRAETQGNLDRINGLVTLLKEKGISLIPGEVDCDSDDNKGSDTVTFYFPTQVRPETLAIIRDHCFDTLDDDEPGALYPPVSKRVELELARES